MPISRYIEKQAAADQKKKMMFVGGPRQTGKTWLAKKILQKTGQDVKSAT